MSDTPVAHRRFAVSQERFTVGKMGASMLKGVDRWSERTREQQDEAVRWVGRGIEQLHARRLRHGKTTV